MGIILTQTGQVSHSGDKTRDRQTCIIHTYSLPSACCPSPSAACAHLPVLCSCILPPSQTTETTPDNMRQIQTNKTNGIFSQTLETGLDRQHAAMGFSLPACWRQAWDMAGVRQTDKA